MQENVKISKIDKKRNYLKKIINFYKKKCSCLISFGKVSQMSFGASNERLCLCTYFYVDPLISSILQA